MKLENQICTLDQAIKLRSLGIVQKSLYYYYRGFSERDHGIQPSKYFDGNTSMNAAYSLFTVAELGVMLGAGYHSGYCNIFNGGAYCAVNEGDDEKDGNCYNAPTEAEARAAMLIHLIENKLLTAEKANQRLKEE